MTSEGSPYGEGFAANGAESANSANCRKGAGERDSVWMCRPLNVNGILPFGPCAPRGLSAPLSYSQSQTLTLRHLRKGRKETFIFHWRSRGHEGNSHAGLWLIR